MKLTRTRLAGPLLAAGAAAVIAGCAPLGYVMRPNGSKVDNS